jgi:hypothetical protein
VGIVGAVFGMVTVSVLVGHPPTSLLAVVGLLGAVLGTALLRTTGLL